MPLCLLKMPSSTVENYLKAILVRSGDGTAIVTTGVIAATLGVNPGTATSMVRSLAAKGLLVYAPRNGVRLTRKGRIHAFSVLRKHRLTEAFLVQVLRMDREDASKEAETLEHAISDKVLARMDNILSHSNADRYGDAIPGFGRLLLDGRKGASSARQYGP